MNIIKPALLKKGDTIGILAPSGAMGEDDTNLKRGIKFFEDRGFRVKLAKTFILKIAILRVLMKNDLKLCTICF